MDSTDQYNNKLRLEFASSFLLLLGCFVAVAVVIAWWFFLIIRRKDTVSTTTETKVRTKGLTTTSLFQQQQRQQQQQKARIDALLAEGKRLGQSTNSDENYEKMQQIQNEIFKIMMEQEEDDYDGERKKSS